MWLQFLQVATINILDVHCLPPASIRCSLVNKEENNAGKTDHDEGDERDWEVAFRQRSLSFACCS